MTTATGRPLRVLLISAGFAIEYPLGGIERFVVALARHLDRTRIEPVVCGLWDWGTEWDQRWLHLLHSEGIAAFTAAPKDDRAPISNFRDLLRGMQAQMTAPVDIIHSHSEFGDVAALLLRRRLGAQAVMRTVHNEREWPKRKLRRLLLTNVAHPLCMDAEFGVSRRVVARLDARPVARVLGRKARVLHNVLDFSRFDVQGDRAVHAARLRAALGIPADAPIIGSVGRLTTQKGYDVLLDAMPALLHAAPNCHVVIVGDGPDRAELAARAAALGVSTHVHLLGARGDIEELLPAFTLFVSPSRWEGLPTVILEAMACQVPVLGTRVSGTVELIEEGVTGALVDAENAHALADGIVQLLRDPTLQRNLSQRANDFARANFSITGVAAQHARLYEELVRKP